MDPFQVSSQLFGRACRLPIAIWILKRDKPRFYQSEPPREIGSATAVRQELMRLTTAGLLIEERPDAENRVYYVRTESAWWAVIQVAAELVEAEASALMD